MGYTNGYLTESKDDERAENENYDTKEVEEDMQLNESMASIDRDYEMASRTFKEVPIPKCFQFMYLMLLYVCVCSLLLRKLLIGKTNKKWKILLRDRLLCVLSTHPTHRMLKFCHLMSSWM
jgi:hypothetical protein